MGRKDLIEGAIPGNKPLCQHWRGMKVGKEEIVGLLAAVERYLKVDHDAEFKELDTSRAVHDRNIAKDLRSDGRPSPSANCESRATFTPDMDGRRLQV